MKKIIFASNNKNKLEEIRKQLDGVIDVQSLEAIQCTEELPETSNTIEGNALQKARYIAEKYQIACFADDTGLEIESLNGEPGVLSARYAGEQKDSNANMDLVLSNLENISNRNAQFKTVIALVLDEKEYLFEGIVKGEISRKKIGEKGFGYDPIFIPEGSYKTFAQMEMSEKNERSHRGIAVAKLVDFLQNYKS